MTLADSNPDLSQSALDEIEKEFGPKKASFVKTDVTDIKQFESEYLFKPKVTFIIIFFSDAFKNTIDTFKHVDILINNAGILNDKIWEKEIAINVVSTISEYQYYNTL